MERTNWRRRGREPRMAAGSTRDGVRIVRSYATGYVFIFFAMQVHVADRLSVQRTYHQLYTRQRYPARRSLQQKTTSMSPRNEECHANLVHK